MAYVLDRSERGKLALTGDEAAACLDALVTNDVVALEPGHGCSAGVLTVKGKLLGELRVLRTDGELWVDVDRDALQDVFDVIRRGMVGWRAELHKRTLQEALLSVAGPGADEVAGIAPGPAEHDHVAGSLGGARVRVVRTPFGVDVVCSAEDRDAVRAALDAPEGTVEDWERMRVEAGRPRWGAELDASVIPQEAGLNDRLVSFTKGCYPGQETVARLFYKGKPNRHLRGLRFDDPVAAVPGAPLVLDGREVGRVGSAVVSEQLGPIGLALVRREAEPGARVAVGEDGAGSAEVVALPFGA